jgi:hypothetical protein
MNNRHKREHLLKVCAHCGKIETDNWTRHWKRNHPGLERMELVPGQVPRQPLPDWFEFLKDAAKMNPSLIKYVEGPISVTATPPTHSQVPDTPEVTEEGGTGMVPPNQP